MLGSPDVYANPRHWLVAAAVLVVMINYFRGRLGR